ncbi:T9SS type A sorting domain-containing protein [Hymenobacter seoulensis]
MQVPSGSSLTLRSTASTTNRYIVISLTSGATGVINGVVNLNGNTNGQPLPQRLTAVSANAIQVQTGGSIIARSIYGHPFGTSGSIPSGNPNDDIVGGSGSVVFNSGATFQQLSGTDPFTPFSNGASPVAVFNAGSTYIYSGGTLSPVGQQYGNLELRTAATVAGTRNLVVLNNLTVSGATANLNVIGGTPPVTTATPQIAGTTIGGDIIINANGATAGSLIFNPGSASNVTLNGAVAQSVGGIGSGTGSGTLTFGSLARLVVNNTSTGGVTMLKPVTVAGLTLTNGLLTTLPTGGVSNVITVPFAVNSSSDALVTGGSPTSFVNGPLTRVITGTETGQPTIVYPIGAIRGTTPVYRPLTFNPNQPSASSYTAQQFEGSPPARSFPPSDPASIKRVSRIRYFTLTAPGATFNNGRITLSFGTDDQVDNAGFLRIAQSVGSNWVSVGGNTSFTAITPPYYAGAITSGIPFSTLGDFVLSSTQLSQAPGNNPLPVELTSFSASRQPQGVLLKWITAAEKGNAFFEVQRSPDREAFTAQGRVNGNGTTATGAAYSFLDRTPLSGTSYYRLRKVDVDGTEVFSQVVAVSGSHELEASFYPNPSNTTVTLPATGSLVKYRIFSSTGQNMVTGEALGGSEIDIQKVPAGLYFVELTSGDKHRVQRFVRQ